MYAGTPPFKEATPSDKWFNLFIRENERFWNIHSNFKNDQEYFPKEFRELIVNMLQIDPENRISPQ